MAQKTIRASQVKKIFITHLHGDHLFGLPGFLCTMSMNMVTPDQDEDEKKITKKPLIEIYGPYGLKKFLLVSLSLSRSLLNFDYVVHEIVPVPSQYETGEDEISWKQWQPLQDVIGEAPHPSEQMREHNLIHFDENTQRYNIISKGPIKVEAGPLTHRLPAFGFVFTETEGKLGKLDLDKLVQFGVPKGPLFGKIQRGQPVTLADGRVAHPKDFLGPSKPGRKIAILQDTSSCSRVAHLCYDCDVMVHEATNEEEHRDPCEKHGHSTPIMAAYFAHSVRARRLVMTHFSQRYKDLKGENTTEKCTNKLVEEAISVLPKDSVVGEVVAAYDGLVVAVNYPT